MSGRSSSTAGALTPYLQVAPLAFLIITMVGIPLLTVVLLSFWG